jgi:hypothetical protein
VKTSWQTTRDGSPQWLYVEADSVTIGAGQGHLEMGSSCSHEEFLAGQWHGEIAALYGAEGLAEVIASVKAAKSYAPFVEKLTRESNLFAQLDAIPVDDSLPTLRAGPRTERGSQNYGNAGGYKTIVRSDSLTLTFNTNKGFLTPNDEELPHRPVTLPGHGSAAVAWKDQFCVVVNSNFVFVDAMGQVDAFPANDQLDLSGAMRIQDCFRHPEAWILGYMLLSDSGYPQYGLLRYVQGVGFVGRWVQS